MSLPYVQREESLLNMVEFTRLRKRIKENRSQAYFNGLLLSSPLVKRLRPLRGILDVIS